MIDIYTDGSCSGNPGPGGWAAIVVNDGRQVKLKGGVERTTSNRMELTAAINGLAHVHENSDVSIYSDSQYLVNTMTRNWKRRANLDLWQRLDELIATRKVKWTWVRGHAGHPGNERANTLAVEMSSSSSRMPRQRGETLPHINSSLQANMADATGKRMDNLNEVMKVALTIPMMKETRAKLLEPVGFIPTMGYLHEGHLSLVRRARRENRSVVVSIFVNPTQFGSSEDLDSYPRDTERDLSLLRREGIDVVFLPEATEMYPPDFNSWVVLEGITDMLEGISRPGHFLGVTTVVAKLLNIVQPHRTYFGGKDAQQVRVIEKMVADLNMGSEIIAVPTVRESDGLAMSSRNIRLDPEEHQSALVLWKSLNLAQQLWSDGERSAGQIRRQMIDLIESEPKARIDYVSIADAESLREIDEIDRPALVSLAIWIGKTRLIDNVILDGAS